MPIFRGRTRAVRALDWALRQIDGSPVEAEIESIVRCLDSGDLIDFSVLYFGGYQPGLVEYIASRLRGRPSVIWDIGANVGSVCLPLAVALPETRIYAFEPSPPVYRRLQKNLALNPSLNSRVVAKPWALSDRTGEMDFYVSKEPSNSGVGGLGHSHNRLQASVRVVSLRGDDILRSKGVSLPDLIKIDVEGFECEVFVGLEGMLRQKTTLEIVFEHCLYRFRERGFQKTKAVDLLRRFGFEFFVLSDDTTRVRLLEEADLDRDCDLVARRTTPAPQ